VACDDPAGWRRGARMNLRALAAAELNTPERQRNCGAVPVGDRVEIRIKDDLRHAGNHLVAEAGANLRELMELMGHSSSRAALIYLHSTPDRQRALAEAIAERTRQEVSGKIGGTVVARNGQADASGDDPPNERGPPELRE
jgi:hypothetical protein